MDVLQAQPLHRSLSSVPAWEQRVLPPREVLLSVRLAPGHGWEQQLDPAPEGTREWSAVPGGKHPSLRDPASSSCVGRKATPLPLSLPTMRVARGSKASARRLHRCSKGTSLAGDGWELSLARRWGWRVDLRVTRGQPQPSRPAGLPAPSPCRRLSKTN